MGNDLVSLKQNKMQNTNAKLRRPLVKQGSMYLHIFFDMHRIFIGKKCSQKIPKKKKLRKEENLSGTV